MTEIAAFGTTAAGLPVRRIALAAGRLRAGVLTLGAILQDFRHADRPLALGAPDLAPYDDGPMRHFGAVIGPVAGRLRDGRGQLGGGTLTLPATEAPHNLHSAAAPLHAAIWRIEAHTEAAVTLVTTAPPGAGGLPGARRFAATYALADDTLTLTLAAETDALTWVNLAHHGYWHLGGPPGIGGHVLRIDAGRVLPIDAEVLPTGEIAPVEGTDFDFRAPRPLGATVLDNCYALAPAPRALAPAAHLTAPDGTALELATTAPGLQVFTGDGVETQGHPSHHGAPYTSRPGLALEPQHWPDAPNHPAFPSISLHPGATWTSVTTFRIVTAR